jgi:Uma2 family endonuclease
MCLRNAELQVQLPLWASGSGGWMALGSSTGFRLPDSSVLSPDVSLVALDRWLALTAEQRRGFPPLCPDLVVELASPSEASPSEQGPAASPPCAGRWRPTSATAPASAGC